MSNQTIEYYEAQIHFLVELLDERQLNKYEEWLEQYN